MGIAQFFYCARLVYTIKSVTFLRGNSVHIVIDFSEIVYNQNNENNNKYIEREERTSSLDDYINNKICLCICCWRMIIADHLQQSYSKFIPFKYFPNLISRQCSSKCCSFIILPKSLKPYTKCWKHIFFPQYLEGKKSDGTLGLLKTSPLRYRQRISPTLNVTICWIVDKYVLPFIPNPGCKITNGRGSSQQHTK